MKEHAKYQQREIAKKRLEAGYKRDKMEAISSADYEQPEEPKIGGSSESTKENKLTNALNDLNSGSPTKSTTKKAESKNTFQQMLKESEMKVSVAKKAPKKGMQLGKPKGKKNAKNPLMADLKQPSTAEGE